MSVSDNEIYVNYGTVSNVGQALADADAAIQRVLAELADTINPLRATWSGASEAEYVGVQNRWDNDIAAMNALLSRYGNTLDEMTVNYGTTDNNLALQWASIT
jgi:WXG100 family type VII secretion target